MQGINFLNLDPGRYKTPASSCSHTPITACIDGDGCCPMGCTALNDNDCGAVCGNGVIEGAEECDGVNLAGQTCVSLD